MKKIIFTVSKDNNIIDWEDYHIKNNFEIYLVDNGNTTYKQHEKFHIMKPKITQEMIGHVNQQEYLMNDFYQSFHDDALIYFIDDDEYVVEVEPLKGNTNLNWRIWNGEYYPKTSLNDFFKPIVKTNQNIILKIHGLIKSSEQNSIKVYDGNGKEINSNIKLLNGVFKNYIKHIQFTSVDSFNSKLLSRPFFEESEYFKIRLNAFWECCPLIPFHMCVIMDDFDKIEYLNNIYPKISFFAISSVIPSNVNVEIIPKEYWICPERFIFKFAEENSFNVVIKRASRINIRKIDIEDEWKNINIYKTIHHYPFLKKSKKIIKRFKNYGLFRFIDIVQFNKYMKDFQESIESKPFKIEFERFKSKEIDEKIGNNMLLDLLNDFV